MYESVNSISSLIEICETKAISIGFKKGHQRTLEPYQSSRIECLTRSIFCFVLFGRVDVHNPKAIFSVSQGEVIVLPEKQLFQISAGDQGAQIYIALKIKKSRK
jgi:ethanolamine utilization protein EutQ (cupin superfamily)